MMKRELGLCVVLMLIGLPTWFREEAAPAGTPGAVPNATPTAAPGPTPSAVPGPARPAPNLENLIESVKGAVCKIAVQDKFGVPFKQGTGFLLEGGRLVSCHHVFQRAAQATVTFSGGQTAQVAGILGEDPQRDVAVALLKSVPEGIPSLQLAEFEVPKLGTDIVAIGYPLGLACTVSKGIITSLPTGADFNRSVGIKICPEDMRLIQTDAAVSHGNSGGPLVTMDGKVIAVIALAQSKGENLGFGIPTAYVRPLLANTTAVKPLGEVTSITSGVARLNPILPPRVKKVTLEEIMVHIARLNNMITCKRCWGTGEVMVTTTTRGSAFDSGRERTEKKQCPACGGDGRLRVDNPAAYDILASMAEPLAYLDTEATSVTPQQAIKIVTALYESVYAVTTGRVPNVTAFKAADILRKATGETPQAVCFPGRVMGKISAGDRDYVITRVVGAEDVSVALVCKAAKYNLKGSYLFAGVVGGRLTPEHGGEKIVFVWPSIVMWPPTSTDWITDYGVTVARTYTPKGLFITSERLLEAAAKADWAKINQGKSGGYVTLP
jgi:S1-C subfamily serine protease